MFSWYNSKSQNPHDLSFRGCLFLYSFSYKLSSSKYKPLGNCVIRFQEKIWSINSFQGSVECWLEAGSVFTAHWLMFRTSLCLGTPHFLLCWPPLELKNVASNTSWSIFQRSTVLYFGCIPLVLLFCIVHFKNSQRKCTNNFCFHVASFLNTKFSFFKCTYGINIYTHPCHPTLG